MGMAGTSWTGYAFEYVKVFHVLLVFLECLSFAELASTWCPTWSTAVTPAGGRPGRAGCSVCQVGSTRAISDGCSRGETRGPERMSASFGGPTAGPDGVSC